MQDVKLNSKRPFKMLLWVIIIC